MSYAETFRVDSHFGDYAKCFIYMGDYAAVSPALSPTIQPKQSFDNKKPLAMNDERFSHFTFYFSLIRFNKVCSRHHCRTYQREEQSLK